MIYNLIGFLIGMSSVGLFFYLKGFIKAWKQDKKDRLFAETMEYKKHRSEYLNEYKNVLKSDNVPRFDMYRELAQLGKCGNCCSDSVEVYHNGNRFANKCGKCGIGL